MRTKTLLILAFIMALITTGLFYVYMNSMSVEMTEQQTITVVRTVQPVDAYQKITAEMVETIQIPYSESYSHAYKKIEDVAGKISASRIAEGEILFAHRLLENEQQIDYLAYVIPQGSRAVSVAVDYVQSVSNLIEPGDRVNVFVTYPPKRPEEDYETRMILENIHVLSVGQRMLPKNPESEEDNQEYHAVTLEVNDQQAQLLIYASEKGSIHLSLRSGKKEE